MSRAEGKGEGIVEQGLSEAERGQSAALVVPLEGVLCRTSLATERLVQGVAADPLGGLMGRSRRRPLPPEALPLDGGVLERVRAARAEGRRTILVTAADQAQAQVVADGLGLFDAVVADAPEDASRVARLAEAAGPGAEVLPARAGAGLSPGAVVRAMRPHQWSKNLLIFLPLLAAHDVAGIGAALAAFVAFSLTASSVYVLNDIADLAADRAHPRKRHRPFAAGEVGVGAGLAIAAALLALAASVALAFTPPVFSLVLVLYYAVTFAYSFWLKRKLVIDVITLAGLYTIRIVAGAAACAIALSPWMLGFSMFLFLALAAVKRQAELVDMLAEGKEERAGRGYVPDDLPVIRAMALAAGYSAVLVFALYVSSEEVTALYTRPEALWLVCPLLLYWISRMVMVTHRGRMEDDPIVFAATDKVSLAVVVVGAAIFVGANLG
ncbi:MAG: UbiA family prenyltransferase [Paracoccaceae bacterium]|nr:UbiA family prenyltransferase [Paracoccaceae bacterium]